MDINRNRRIQIHHWWMAPTLALSFLVAIPLFGQTQSNIPRDNDTANWQIANMDRFLDSHPEISEQLRRDPSLIRNEEFVANHPALQQYLQQHPGIREEFSENPNAFMKQEQRFERREDEDRKQRFGDRDTTHGELATMDRFLDNHREIAEQLQKNPSLIKNKEFVDSHPALQQFLQQHPGVREEFSENPNAFMRQEQRFEGREDEDRTRGFGDRDTTRGELATMDRFLDNHPEISEQLQRDPSLIKNREFVEAHPALQEFLKTHPEVREEFRENPDAFMKREQRFDQREDSREFRDHDRDRGEMKNFGEFLSGHSTVAQQLAKNPQLANNKEFLENHPELRDFLNSHPGVQQGLAKDPASVMNSPELAPGAATGKAPSPKLKPMHKQ